MITEKENKDDSNVLLSSIIESEQIDENERTIMKGDTVGDTAYSAKWILKTLIFLSKTPEEIEWTDNFENELCFLWDMTAEKDIVFFLIDNQFLSIAEYILNTSTNDRMTEIIVGIIGNLSCQTKVLEEIAERKELVQLLIDLLSSNDTETLIQLLRIFQTVFYNLQSDNPYQKWIEHFRECKSIGNTLTFILQSSTNENLLISALNLVQSSISIECFSRNFFQEIFDMKNLLSSLIEAFSQLIPHKLNDQIHTHVEIEIIVNWLEILSKILEVSALNAREIVENDGVVAKVLARIIEPYRALENLRMIGLTEEKIIECINQCVELIFWLQRSGFIVHTEDIAIVVEMMYHLHSLTRENSNETEDFGKLEEVQENVERHWVELVKAGDVVYIEEILKTTSETTRHYIQNYSTPNDL